MNLFYFAKNTTFAAILCGVLSSVPSTFSASEPDDDQLIDFASIIQITFEQNLEIAAARFDIEASDYQFRRFERNLSQFVPLIVETTAERDSDSFLDDDERIREDDDETAASVGFEKEFFDGKRISGASGMRKTSNSNGTNSNPFIGGEIRFPLFGSFTTLERVTERNFEENELLNAWLDFIDTVRESISESHEAYLEVEQAVGINSLIAAAITDFNLIRELPVSAGVMDDALQVDDQIQDLQSQSVNFAGEVDASLIGLMENLGLDDVRLDQIRHLELNGGDYYGKRYIDSDIETIINEAIENDVEIRVIKVARSNAELKKDLAKKGKWDIFGKLFGNYDFEQRGDDRRRRSSYELGLGFSVQRNDPKLLLLSMQQADAEIKRFDAQVEWRERKVHHLIKRKISQARSSRHLIEELKTSRTLRQSVFAQKLEAYKSGNESIDNLIQSRDSLFDTEKDIVERIEEFFEIVIELDVTSGFYFKHLGDLVNEIGEAYDFNHRENGS